MQSKTFEPGTRVKFVGWDQRWYEGTYQSTESDKYGDYYVIQADGYPEPNHVCVDHWSGQSVTEAAK